MADHAQWEGGPESLLIELVGHWLPPLLLLFVLIMTAVWLVTRPWRRWRQPTEEGPDEPTPPPLNDVEVRLILASNRTDQRKAAMIRRLQQQRERQRQEGPH